MRCPGSVARGCASTGVCSTEPVGTPLETMDERRLVRLSKYLSKHLRHQPQRLGLTIAPGGWVPVAELLAAARRNGVTLSWAELEYVVAHNDKQRFGFDETGTLIRARQGHSVAVDLGPEALEPPEELFHGTGHRSARAIERDGLRAMGRHHVHLSVDVQTARRVGARHGRPVVYRVAAGRMHRAGYCFYRSDNGVWLVEHVPVAFLERLVS